MDKKAAIEAARANQTKFTFGEKVKLVCLGGQDEASAELTCLTDGTFSGPRMFCGISMYHTN